MRQEEQQRQARPSKQPAPQVPKAQQQAQQKAQQVRPPQQQARPPQQQARPQKQPAAASVPPSSASLQQVVAAAVPRLAPFQRDLVLVLLKSWGVETPAEAGVLLSDANSFNEAVAASVDDGVTRLAWVNIKNACAACS